MSKVVITGNTKGIGLEFYNYFVKKGWDVVGFNSKTGLDRVIEECYDCDLFINNAYADGKQLELFDRLHDKVPRMIVCGSVAAFYPDPKLPLYSEHKKQLDRKVKESSNKNILMLHLSAKGYNDSTALIKLIDIWLDHPSMIEVMFDPTGEPNG